MAGISFCAADEDVVDVEYTNRIFGLNVACPRGVCSLGAVGGLPKPLDLPRAALEATFAATRRRIFFWFGLRIAYTLQPALHRQSARRESFDQGIEPCA